jgi:hypothetical protein
LSIRRRRGNNDARLSLQPNDYLGNIEWLGTRNASGAVQNNGRQVRIAPRIDSTYVANSATLPVGIEYWVSNGSANITHFMYANGNVSFASFVNATNFTASSNVNANNANIGSGNIDLYANGEINTTGLITTTGNVNAENINISSGDIYLYANGDISASGRLSYLRTYGDFYSNATQTSAGANTVNYMTLNNTGLANGVSIANSDEITIARTGNYNIQFSAQLSHDTNQTANVEIWLAKNGNNLANTNTRLTLVKDEAVVASWNWLVNANTANDYYQIAWASSDTNVELVYVDAGNTIANVAIPSVIVTVVPVGA